MTGSLEIGKFLRRQSVSIFRATAHALPSTGFLSWLLAGSSGSFRSKTMCKSVYTYLTICFAFEKPRWLLHNTADRAETVFSHLNTAGISVPEPCSYLLGRKMSLSAERVKLFAEKCTALGKKLGVDVVDLHSLFHSQPVRQNVSTFSFCR